MFVVTETAMETSKLAWQSLIQITVIFTPYVTLQVAKEKKECYPVHLKISHEYS